MNIKEEVDKGYTCEGVPSTGEILDQIALPDKYASMMQECIDLRGKDAETERSGCEASRRITQDIANGDYRETTTNPLGRVKIWGKNYMWVEETKEWVVSK